MNDKQNKGEFRITDHKIPESFNQLLKRIITHEQDTLTNIIDHSIFGLSIFAGEQCVYANRKIGEIMALPLKDFKDFKFEEFGRFVDSNEYSTFFNIYNEYKQTKKAKSTIHKIISANGIHKLVLFIFFPLIFKENEFFSLFLVDLTESEHINLHISDVNETNHMSTADLTKFFDVFPIGVITDDLKGDILYVNKSFERTFGYKYKDFLSAKDWLAVLIPDEVYRQETVKLFSSPSVKEIIIQNKNGEENTVEWVIFSFKGISKRIHFIKDISKKKDNEAEIRVEKRLNALSLLTGGIAHDYNNILLGIMGSLDEFDESKMNEHELASLYNIRFALDRAKKLTNQLQKFAKGGDAIKNLTVMNEVIENAVNLVTLQTRCIVLTKYYNENIIAHIDPDQIHQAITNLLLNAAQANQNEGIIKISLKLVDKNFRMKIPNGQYIEVLVEDEGPGIAKEIEAKIFDLYASTKTDGHGLGLAIVSSVIKKHDGYVGFESNESGGASFFFYLPYYKEFNQDTDIKQLILSGSKNDLSTQVSETNEIDIQPEAEKKPFIIVMDDDTNVRTTISRMVEKLGFCPVQCKDGASTLDEYRKLSQENREIKLILVDLTINDGMSGLEFISDFREIDKETPCIVCSGYIDVSTMKNLTYYGFNDYLQKPFTKKNLEEAINKLGQ